MLTKRKEKEEDNPRKNFHQSKKREKVKGVPFVFPQKK